MSELYQRYRDLYMRNMVLLSTVQKLVAAGKLTETEVDIMIADRLAVYGY